MQPSARLLLLSLLAPACVPDGEPAEAAAYVDDGSVVATLSDDVVTVAYVSAATSRDAEVVVEYGLDTDYGQVTPATPVGLTHEVTLLGLKPGRTYHYRVVARAGSERDAGEDHTIVTGELPDDMPTFALEVEEADGTVGAYALAAVQTSGDPSVGRAMIVDEDGDVVWYSPGYTANTIVWAEFDGKGNVLLLESNVGEDTQATLHRMSLDARSVEDVDLGTAHHAATQDVPGVMLAAVTKDVREWEGELVGGDTIVEFSADGTQRTVWSAWDTMVPLHHPGWTYEEQFADWTHVNGIAYDPTDDAYYVSLFWLGSVLKIDRATGQIVWQFGGDGSDVAARPDEAFWHVHSPEPLADGRLALFDNGTAEGAAVTVYAIDPLAGTAVREEVHLLEEGRTVAVLGDMDLQSDGSWFSTWGDMGRMAVLGADGGVAWDVQVEPAGTRVGFGERVTDLWTADR